MSIRSKKIIAILVTIFATTMITLFIEGLLLFIATARTTISTSSTGVVTTVQDTTYYPGSILLVVENLVIYIILLWGVSLLGSALVNIRDIREDWGLRVKIISATTSFILSTLMLFGATSHSHSSPLGILIGYITLYVLFVGYQVFKSKKAVKGLKSEEVFQ